MPAVFFILEITILSAQASCLFSGQQHEDIRIRCKISAGRNSTWIGDAPSQNVEETQSS